MFKKLKDKIAEEVKFSPQRIQQLTQSVTDKLQNNSNEESFFSITEDDSLASTSFADPGFTDVSLQSPSAMDPRTRRYSNTSMASDISFLPRYDPPSSLYHMQSDLDASASEFEDNISTSSQLGHISKEQVYAAFQKAQMRYHKYRGRYTDLANHYKILEKENAKIKSVLVETQDKAIRRANELREQCSLEQKAKAHLENALRVELDERQMKIDTLQTKIKYLQSENLVELTDTSTENLELLTKQLNDSRLEIENLNQKMQELKANSIIFNTKESDYKTKIADLEKNLHERTADNLQFAEREKENNLKLAQSKMELHAEINNKDVELSNLKRESDKLRSELEKSEKSKNGNLKIENLQTQNGKLIEKIEMLTQKCSNYENELVKLEQFKIEISNLKKEKEDTTTEHNLKLEKLQAAVEESKRLCNELESKSGNLNSLQEENESLNRRIRDIAKENEDFNKQNSEFETENQSLKDRIEEITKNNDEITKEKGDLTKTIEDLTKDKQTLEDQLNALEESVLNLKQFEAKVSELEETLSLNEKNHSDEMEKVRNSTRNSLITLETKIKEKVESEYKEKENALRLEFDKRFETISSNETKDAEMKLMQTQDELKASVEENHNLKGAAEELKAKYYELETNHLDLINENGQTRNELAKLEKDNVANAKNVEALQKQLKGLRDEHQAESINRENVEKLLEEKNSDLVDLQKKIDELTKVIDEDKKQLDSMEVLRNELSLLQEVSTEQQNKNCTLLDENKDLLAKINELQASGMLLEESITAVTQERENLNETTKNLLEKNSELTSKLASYEEENYKLQKDIDNILLKKEEIFGKFENIKRLHDEVEDKYLNLQQRFLEKEGVVLQLEETVKVQTISIDEYKNQKDTLNRDLEDLRKELTTRNEEFTLLNQNKTQLEALLSDTKTNEEKIREVLQEQEKLQKVLLEKEKSIEDFKLIKVDSEKTIDNLKQYESKYQNILDENQNLKEQITQIEELKMKLQAFETVRNDLDNLNKSLDLSEKQKNELSNDLKKLKQELLDLKVTNEKLKSTDNENDKLNEDIANLRSQLKEFANCNQILNEEKRTFEVIERKYSQVDAELLDTKNRTNELRTQNHELQERNQQLSSDYNHILRENEKHLADFAEYKLRYDEVDVQIRDFGKVKLGYEETIASLNESLYRITKELSEVKSEKEQLEQLKNSFVESTENQTSSLVNKIRQLETEKSDYDNLTKEHRSSKSEINNLTQMYEKTYKEKKEIESQLHELERHYNEMTHEKQLLLDEIQELKISPINLTANSLDNPTSNKNTEIDALRDKLEQYKSIDKANRASIQFYENELEKLKLKNEKLGRRLDETLVALPSLSGDADFSDSAAILQYLRNVIFNYMTGKEGLVLAKVIAAVCKFDKEQTELVLQKEQQKQTLIGHLFGS